MFAWAVIKARQTVGSGVGQLLGMFERFLAEEDVRRVEACLATLRRHGTAEWALTGSVAVESLLDANRY
jgi:hypothetical protein